MWCGVAFANWKHDYRQTGLYAWVGLYDGVDEGSLVIRPLAGKGVSVFRTLRDFLEKRGINDFEMKVFIVGVILATIGFQSITALKCMQGVEVEKNGAKAEQKDKEKMPEITECGITTAVASTALLFAVKPSTISIPSGDYKCYHLKYEENNSETSTIIKGCIYNSLNVCDGKFSSSNTKESFCSQCTEDGCNSGERFGLSFKLLGLTVVAMLAYLLN